MTYPYLKNIDQLASLVRFEKFKLGKNHYRCFESYAKNPGKNEYELFKKNYSNFKRLIKKLVSEGLLAKINQKSKPPNYYKLTDIAIFYLYYKRESLTNELFRALLQNYSESIIIQSFLYPFFHQKTLLQLMGSYQLQILTKYMFECTAEVKQYMNYMTNTRQMGEFLFSWDIFNKKITHSISETGLFQLREFLKHRLKLDWVDNAELKLEDSHTMVLSKGLKLLRIKLNDNKDKAILSYKGNKCTLNVSSFPDMNGIKQPFSVCAPYRTKEENALEFYSTRMDSVIVSMVTSLLAKPLIREDEMLLSADEKFVKILTEVKRTFDGRFYGIIRTKL